MKLKKWENEQLSLTYCILCLPCIIYKFAVHKFIFFMRLWSVWIFNSLAWHIFHYSHHMSGVKQKFGIQTSVKMEKSA